MSPLPSEGVKWTPKFQGNKREVHPFLVEETEAGGD